MREKFQVEEVADMMDGLDAILDHVEGDSDADEELVVAIFARRSGEMTEADHQQLAHLLHEHFGAVRIGSVAKPMDLPYVA